MMTAGRTLLLQVLLLLVVAIPAARASRTHFEQWKAAHGKTYASAAEEALRYSHWRQQFEHVQQQHHHHHQAHPHSAPAYELGLNEFSDLSPEEHRGRFLSAGFVPQGWRAAMDLSHPRVFNGDKHSDPPPAVDWRQPATNPKGVKAVTPVRNQGYW
jgi:hypothetical protein